MTVRIAPSILSADFARLADEIARIEQGGADLVHVDVMDGHFVPNITIGLPVVAALRRVTRLPLDVHLMISEPDRYLEAFVDAGSAALAVHVEVAPHLHRTLARIRELGARAGVAVNPSTPLSAVVEVIHEMDHLLIMSVNPGFGGQSFIPGSLDRVAAARAMLDAAGSAAAIGVDGGVDESNAAPLVAAGASVLVAGASIFGASDPVEATRALRRAAAAGETLEAGRRAPSPSR
jgi:ribulose-phosphate 3-epimerase